MAGLFGHALAGRIELAQLSKATLTELSHVLENMVIGHDLPATVLTGFQAARNWTAELARYERLVAPLARNVAVFATGNLGDTGRVVGFRLDEDSRLRQEWFLIVLTPEFSVALFGEDNPDLMAPAEEMDRVFDAAWTFDPAMVGVLCDTLVDEVRRTHPDRVQEVAEAIAAHPPRAANPIFEQRFTARVFEAMEAGRRRWRRALVRAEDIHERLAVANSELVRLERLAAVGTTAATLAHELNNPLATVSMTAELIAMQAESGTMDAAAMQRWAEGITHAAARAGRMTRGILDFVRSHDATIVPLQLASWLQRFGEEMSAATHRPVRIECPESLVVAADDDRLRHILTNLVNNGLQASDASTPVVVAASAAAGAAEIRVRDHGTGIDQRIVDHLFQPFHTTKAAHGGTGLGLALALRFAEDQGATLRLEQTGPEGTTFLLRLPLGETPADAEGERPSDTPSDAAADRRILVVDDDPDVRALLAHLLRQAGWVVHTAGDSDAAVESVMARRHDAILLDHRLSDGSTTPEVLDRLTAARPGCVSRVVLMTGSLSRELPPGLPPVLLKPFTRAELEATLASRITSA